MRNGTAFTRGLTAGTPAALMFSGTALGGTPGTITFAPASVAAVPTLGGALLVLLAALLGVIGLRAARQRRAPLLVAALAAGALATGGGGLQLVSKAVAGADISVTPIDSDDGQQQFSLGSGPNLFRNDTAIPMEVVDIQLDERCFSTDPVGLDPACSLGDQLPPAERCEINIGCNLDSDRRLKTDVRQVGITHNALPLYEFRYRGRPGVYRGVMAQDVLKHTPEAVVLQPSGYYAVDYGALGLTMERVR